MDNAFNPGDPALEVAGVVSGKHQYAYEEHWIPRDEQMRIDDIVSGRRGGHYYLIVGEKGTGKTSMLLEAMRKINGLGCAMFEAHADLEIFRIRLGKALDYEFHEEYAFPVFLVSRCFLTDYIATLAAFSVFVARVIPQPYWTSSEPSTNLRRLLWPEERMARHHSSSLSTVLTWFGTITMARICLR